jgi:4-amino-4-deoxy-L-arabinose transferase-like glycosyltransferase
VKTIRSRNWRRISQLLVGLLLSVAVFAPWYRTNWLLILTGGKRATVDSAIAEGDPALNTIAAWTYYWKVLPEQVSWLLLLVPIVGLLLYWNRQGADEWRLPRLSPLHPISSLSWLLIFCVGAYLLCSLNINKDYRYVLPYLPVVALFLAYGITRWYGIWGKRIRWATIGLAVVLMFLNLFPVGGVVGNSIAQALSPDAQHHAYLKIEYPHRQVVDEIIQTAPDVSSTLGVLPSTPEINQHNLNYYGALQNFQVYGRQVGTVKKQVSQDARSLDWFLTKTGNQGSVPASQAQIVQLVESSSDFSLHKKWDLRESFRGDNSSQNLSSDGSILKLYHRRQPSVQVKPLTDRQNTGERIQLLGIKVPSEAPPGIPVPVTYEWSGSWEQLQPGLVLLTWHNQSVPNLRDRWLHDHGIGMGTLVEKQGSRGAQKRQFRITERMAMLPPANLLAGSYTLEATYLNRETGETYPISVPPVTLKIDSAASATLAPELDLLTQHRTLAAALPQGIKALERVFAEIGRINQYDPIQDYLVQTQLAMEYRLQKEPRNIDWAYVLALSNVLQQQVQGAIAAFERVTQLDSQNPYAYAYLAFVHLYNWNGAAAQTALKPALALKPNSPELQTLSGIAALMQGNLLKAWQDLSTLRSSLTTNH